MSFMDKLKFWKKDDEFGDMDMDKNFGLGGGPADVFPELSQPKQQFGELAPMSRQNPMANQMQDPMAQQRNPMESDLLRPAPEPMHQQPLYKQVEPPINKDMEIISLKLDAIKNGLDAVNARLERLEQMAKGPGY